MLQKPGVDKFCIWMLTLVWIKLKATAASIAKVSQNLTLGVCHISQSAAHFNNYLSAKFQRFLKVAF